jgi:selenocysteine-specific elongation factor
VPADHDQPLTLGTAGHIDHGKTALVAALTGVDTDRLPEEKSRGISIDLGYAPLLLPSGRRLSVVDVPGHERFVRTMVAGATGIDLFLLVVAADDGVMPQTREHLAILELLGIHDGVVAITKRDRVDAETAELVRLEVAELLADGPAADVAVIEVSARTSEGLEGLRTALEEAASRAGGRAAGGPVRLPIDRSFTLRGIGTVATGTLWSGTIGVNDRLVLEPDGRPVRVRSVQVHDQPVERVAAGQRTAVSLVGAERSQVRRGQTLASPGSLTPSYRLDCQVQVLGFPDQALRRGLPVTVHHGTAEFPARVAIPGDGEIPPGGSGRVQLRLRRRAVALAGDHVIVRLTAPPLTIAGGTVIDPAPPRTARSRTPAPSEAAAPAAPAGPPPGTAELLARLAAAPLTPPDLTAADEPAIAYLVSNGRAVRASRELAFTAEAFADATAAAIQLATAAGTVSLASLRDRLGISRKYAQALLEAMDAAGVTRRVGDERRLRRRGRELGVTGSPVVTSSDDQDGKEG